MSGPLPLSYTELQSWSAMTGTELSRDEVAVLMAMDDAFLRAVQNERPKPETEPIKGQ